VKFPKRSTSLQSLTLRLLLLNYRTSHQVLGSCTSKNKYYNNQHRQYCLHHQR
jgi:hypothetical protein